MGTFHEDIPDNIYQWILLQKMFWVATAPLSKSGHINVSPKGTKLKSRRPTREFENVSGYP